MWIVNEDKGYDFPYFKDYIIIPYMRGSRYVTLQGRALDENAKKKYLFLPKRDNCLYHAEDLAKRGRVYLTEGAFKRDRLVQEGQKAVALSGANQFKQHLSELNRCDDLWIVLDSDAPNEKGQRPGNDAAEELVRHLTKCTLVTLPLCGQEKMGVDDFIEEYGIEAFLNLPADKYERGTKSKPTSLSILVANWREQIEENEGGYLTGHPRLDEWLGGYHKGALTFIAGSPHAGKSSIMEDSMMRVYKYHPDLLIDYYSNDDSLFVTITRLVAKIAGLKPKDVRYAKVALEDRPEDMVRFEAAAAKLAGKSDRLKILDRSYNIHLEKLKDELLRWREENPQGEKIVFIDAFTKTMTRKDDELRDEISRAMYKSSLLKEIAQQAHVPLIVSHELPKMFGKRPNSWNLRSSNTLEYDADVILLCYQEATVRGLHGTSIKVEYEDGWCNPILEVKVGKDKVFGCPPQTDLFELRKQDFKIRELSPDDYQNMIQKVRESERKQWE